jgi:diguanylate cyclase (GGDEF)-like protein
MSHDESRQPIEALVEAYTAWVRELRQGSVPPPLAPPASDGPLARLGQELDLLSAALMRREDELRKLFDLVQTVESGVLLDEVLTRIFEGFSGIIPYERIACAFLSDDGSRVTAYWARSNLGPVQITPGYSQPMAGSSLETILASGQPRIIDDLETYFASKPESAGTRRILAEGGRSSLTCPLIVNGRPLGFLFFTSSRKHAYNATHQTVFRQIAAQVSSVIGKSRMYEQLIAHNRELLDQTQTLERIATTDALTGVLNRRAIDAVVGNVWVRYRQTRQPFGLVLADIDHFKGVNDTFGHVAGDRALLEVARRLAGRLRQSDAIGRYGGEEFLMVIDAVDSTELLEAAEQLRAALAGTPFDLGSPVDVTASFGVVQAHEDAGSAADLVQHADRALYAAKAAGRNRCMLLV